MGSEAPAKVAMVEISVLAHATEDLGKVERAAMNVAPKDLQSQISFSRQYLKGHHGNPIAAIKAKVRDEGLVNAVISNLALRLDEEDKQRISLEFDRYVDESGTLYLRLDKQKAYMEIFKLKQENPIKIMVKLAAKHGGIQNLNEAYRSIGLLK